MNNETDVKQGQIDKLPLFDYKQVDKETAKYLKQKAKKLSKIDSLSLGNAGKELKEVQELLAETKGSFQEWTESLGISPKTAYNYMNVYSLFVKHVSHVKQLEKLPARILYQIAKPSAHPKLVEAVIAGTVTSFKELKEYESSLVAPDEVDDKVDNIEIDKEKEQDHCEEQIDDKSYKKHLGLIYDEVAIFKTRIQQENKIDEPEKLLNILEVLNKELLNIQEVIMKHSDQNINSETRKEARFLFDIYTKK